MPPNSFGVSPSAYYLWLRKLAALEAFALAKLVPLVLELIAAFGVVLADFELLLHRFVQALAVLLGRLRDTRVHDVVQHRVVVGTEVVQRLQVALVELPCAVEGIVVGTNG